MCGVVGAGVDGPNIPAGTDVCVLCLVLGGSHAFTWRHREVSPTVAPSRLSRHMDIPRDLLVKKADNPLWEI